MVRAKPGDPPEVMMVGVEYRSALGLAESDGSGVPDGTPRSITGPDGCALPRG